MSPGAPRRLVGSPSGGEPLYGNSGSVALARLRTKPRKRGTPAHCVALLRLQNLLGRPTLEAASEADDPGAATGEEAGEDILIRGVEEIGDGQAVFHGHGRFFGE